jgi:hypothetical protein
MTQHTWAPRAFVSTVSVALVIAGSAHWVAGRYTLQHSSADVAAVLACHVAPTDVVAVVDEYPYDLPFYAQLQQPLEVVQDWDTLRRTAGDNWRRELFEGADFDARAGESLVPLTRLAGLKKEPRAWVVAPKTSATLNAQQHEGFVPVFAGQAWTLYRSAAMQTTDVSKRACGETPKND